MKFVKICAVEHHLPCEISRCYLLTDTGEPALFKPQSDRPVLDLPTPEGQKAELTLLPLPTASLFDSKCHLRLTVLFSHQNFRNSYKWIWLKFSGKAGFNPFDSFGGENGMSPPGEQEKLVVVGGGSYCVSALFVVGYIYIPGGDKKTF